MSKNIDLHIFGQNLRLSCPEDQHQALKTAAANLEKRVNELKARTNILQLEKVLAIVGLNLSYELEQEKLKNSTQTNVVTDRIQQMDHSLSDILANTRPLRINLTSDNQK
ncbi:cell division protein ZapA [Mergibacter septicus]|uniref:cell division protein ZapA n=1 Tax=Mergibacter septicus TaxID=221402 RepID=UPI00117922D2|nr:cell division protein ZapA [Mergibacter septicus]AWX14462.1 cell division protein ZapA [Mergibacter septicus]